jgi:hypothetical protein
MLTLKEIARLFKLGNRGKKIYVLIINAVSLAMNTVILNGIVLHWIRMIMYLAKIWIYQFPPPPRYKMFAVNDALLFLPEDYSIGWQGSHFGVLHFEKNYHYKTVSLHFQNSISVDRKFVVKGATRLQLFFALADFIPLHFFN